MLLRSTPRCIVRAKECQIIYKSCPTHQFSPTTSCSKGILNQLVTCTSNICIFEKRVDVSSQSSCHVTSVCVCCVCVCCVCVCCVCVCVCVVCKGVRYALLMAQNRFSCCYDLACPAERCSQTTPRWDVVVSARCHGL